MERFYKPAGARLGDVIPYYEGGVFHIFYLKRYADDTHDRPETVWGHLVTRDFVEIEDLGVALPPGDERSDDPSVATGSVVRVGDEYLAYYTGFSDWNLHNGGRNQTVLRARSTDLRAWTKDPSFRLVADERRYQRHEWRDPFVFEQPDGGGWRMLVSAQTTGGPERRRGALASLSSSDGVEWQHDDAPFWAPGLTFMHECADVFRMGDHWYLVYSTLTDRTVTRYRMASDPSGPWWSPPDDELDGLGLYAAKTVSDGERRYLVGWCVNRAGGRDDGDWLWGGNLVVHELGARADGTLTVRLPDVVGAARRRRSALPPKALAPLAVEASHGYGSETLCPMPDSGLLRVRLSPDAGTRRFGIELRTTSERDRGYAIVFEPGLNRLIVDRLSRFGAEAPLDVRPYTWSGAAVALTVEFDGEIAIVYVDAERAITLRGYDTYGTDLGVFAVEGAVRADEAELLTIRSSAEAPR